MAAVVVNRVLVAVLTDDELSKAGLVAHLWRCPEVRVVDDACSDVTAVVVADEIDEGALRWIRTAHAASSRGIVLVVRRLDTGLQAAIDAGVSTLLPRASVTSERLVESILTASRGTEEQSLDLVGRLIEQLRRRTEPMGLITGDGGRFTKREIDVLRLVAEGYDTAEVGRRLYCSERTVKYVLQAATSRLQLRNRTHAVAYAVRLGLI